MLSSFSPKTQQPPLSNRGVNCSIDALVDWVQGTFPADNARAVMGVVGMIYGGAFLQSSVRPTGYASAYQNSKGILIGYDNFGGDSRWFIQFKASHLSELTQQQTQELFRGLLAVGFRASRIDLTLDDFQKRFTASMVSELYDKNQGVKGFHEGKRNSAGVFYKAGYKGYRGNTMSFGRRGKKGGGKQLNIYDKGLESNGKRDCTRVELALYNTSSSNFAADAFEALAGSDDWSDIIKQYINWSVDFRDRGGNVKKPWSRCDRVSWWDDFLGDVVEFAPPRKVSKPSIEKSMDWLMGQVAPTIATIFQYFAATAKGGDHWNEYFQPWLFDILDNGESRMNERHFLILNSA